MYKKRRFSWHSFDAKLRDFQTAGFREREQKNFIIRPKGEKDDVSYQFSTNLIR